MPGTRKEYAGEGIVVSWDPTLCIHVAECLRGAPRSFDTRRRPWITLEGADADEIARVVQRCPSGALAYRRTDGVPDEVPADPTSVRAVRNGPYYVRGQFEVVTEAGGLLHTATRASLCRCGGSRNKPFCDNSHIMLGFRDPDPNVEAAAE